MLQERKSNGKVLSLQNKDPKFNLDKKLDKQLRLLQDTIVKLEDIEMQRLVNGLVANMLTYPQSNEPGIAKDLNADDVKRIESNSDLSHSEKSMIYEIGEKLAYLKDLMGDKD